MTEVFDKFVQNCQECTFGNSIISIWHYPHPLHDGGLIVVLDGEMFDALSFLKVCGTIQSFLPKPYTLHILRQTEIGSLSSPGMFAPGLHANELPHLPFFLFHKGQCLYGTSIQDGAKNILDLVDTSQYLNMHIEGCFDYLRRYGIMTNLIQERYQKLANILDREVYLLMTTGLLVAGVWDIDISKQLSLETSFLEIYSSPLIENALISFFDIELGENDKEKASLSKLYWFESLLKRLYREEL